MNAPRIASIGDNDVDCYAHLDEMFPGGNCLNVSVFARRFGARSDYIGRVGDDPAGTVIRDALVAEGVGVDRLTVLPDDTTAWCRIGLRDGERYFIDNETGASRFTPDAADLACIGRADAVHVGATSGLDAHIPEFASRTRLSYDFSLLREPEHVDAIASSAFLSTFSGGGLDDASAEGLAMRAVRAGSEWALVTLGSRGAVLARGAERWRCLATEAEVVDTLGAGDTFLARTLVGLLRGEEPVYLLGEASRAAAKTCAHFGAFGHGASIASGKPGFGTPFPRPAGPSTHRE